MALSYYYDENAKDYLPIAGSGGGGIADLSPVSDEFSSAKSYDPGEYCIYNNALYKFIAHKDPGAWSDLAVERTNVGNEFTTIDGRFSNVFTGYYIPSATSVTNVIIEVHNMLKNRQSIHAIVKIGSNEAVVIGGRISSGRGRYLLLRQQNNLTSIYQMTGANSVDSFDIGES